MTHSAAPANNIGSPPSPLPDTPPGASPQPRIHDLLYRRYVTSDTDLIGHVAYSLYKRQKVAFVSSIHDEYRRSPSGDELDAFRRQAALDDTLDQCRGAAEQILMEFGEATLEAERQVRDQEFEHRLRAELKKPHSFWRGVLENMIANLIVIVLSAILLFSLVLSKLNFWEAIKFTMRGKHSAANAPTANQAAAPFCP